MTDIPKIGVPIQDGETPSPEELQKELSKEKPVMMHTITQDPYNKDRGFKVTEKNFQESKELIQNFKSNIANYPKHLSYEGSMVVCVMLSMHNEVDVPLVSLPQVDQQLIKQIISSDIKSIFVKFDKNKDFICSSTYAEDKYYKNFVLINTVAHPRPDDLKDIQQGEVDVEEKEGTIKVGNGTIIIDKQRLANLAAVPQKEVYTPSARNVLEPEQPVIKATNKNAYEIRSDVLSMAINWSSREDVSAGYTTPESVIDLAWKFYRFVENRR